MLSSQVHSTSGESKVTNVMKGITSRSRNIVGNVDVDTDSGDGLIRVLPDNSESGITTTNDSPQIPRC